MEGTWLGWLLSGFGLGIPPELRINSGRVARLWRSWLSSEKATWFFRWKTSVHNPEHSLQNCPTHTLERTRVCGLTSGTTCGDPRRNFKRLPTSSRTPASKFDMTIAAFEGRQKKKRRGRVERQVKDAPQWHSLVKACVHPRTKRIQ